MIFYTIKSNQIKRKSSVDVKGLNLQTQGADPHRTFPVIWQLLSNCFRPRQAPDPWTERTTRHTTHNWAEKPPKYTSKQLQPFWKKLCIKCSLATNKDLLSANICNAKVNKSSINKRKETFKLQSLTERLNVIFSVALNYFRKSVICKCVFVPDWITDSFQWGQTWKQSCWNNVYLTY